MELRHLRYFAAVASEGQMTKAAELLGIQQPPLSAQIKDLEQELGFSLFSRHPKGMKLTKAGLVFYQSTLDILKHVEQAKDQAQRTHLGLVGELIVGVTTSVAAHHVFSNMIKSFRSIYPLVKMKIIENNAEVLMHQLLSHQVQTVLLRLPVFESPELQSTVLMEEPVMLALPMDHPLLKTYRAKKTGTLSIKDLEGEQLILVRRSGAPGMYQNLLRDCRLNGFEPQVFAEVDNMLTNINWVAAGVGLSVVPASMSCFHRHAVSFMPLTGVQHVKAPITIMQKKDETSQIVANFVMVAHAQSELSSAQAPQPF